MHIKQQKNIRSISIYHYNYYYYYEYTLYICIKIFQYFQLCLCVCLVSLFFMYVCVNLSYFKLSSVIPCSFTQPSVIAFEQSDGYVFFFPSAQKINIVMLYSLCSN